LNGVNLHRSSLPKTQLTVVSGIRCTNVERTIIDCAGELPESQLSRAINEAVIAGKTTYVSISTLLDAIGHGGRKGVTALSQILQQHLPITGELQSFIQLKVVRAARRGRLPIPVTEYRVDAKNGPYFIDVAWPEFKIGAEADGFSVHGTSRVRHTKDRRRRNELETLGWKIVNFTHEMSVEEISDVLVANIKEAMGK
jgi:very-short-patch-repair endonuclease